MSLVGDDPKTTMTEPHKKLITLLGLMGYENTLEVEKSFPPYSVDCYISHHHLAFEADGPQHNKKRDQKRDEVLLTVYALPVIRMSDFSGSIYEQLARLTNLILDRMNEGDSAIQRRDYARNNGWQDI